MSVIPLTNTVTKTTQDEYDTYEINGAIPQINWSTEASKDGVQGIKQYNTVSEKDMQTLMTGARNIDQYLKHISAKDYTTNQCRQCQECQGECRYPECLRWFDNCAASILSRGEDATPITYTYTLEEKTAYWTGWQIEWMWSDNSYWIDNDGSFTNPLFTFSGTESDTTSFVSVKDVAIVFGATSNTSVVCTSPLTGSSKSITIPIAQKSIDEIKKWDGNGGYVVNGYHINFRYAATTGGSMKKRPTGSGALTWSEGNKQESLWKQFSFTFSSTASDAELKSYCGNFISVAFFPKVLTQMGAFDINYVACFVRGYSRVKNKREETIE